ALLKTRTYLGLLTPCLALHGSQRLLNGDEEREIELVCVNDIELDEMWSFVGHKKNQRWLWHAIDHSTRKIIAYHFGRRKDEALIALKSKLSSFNIRYYYTDDWGSYQRILPEDSHFIGKKTHRPLSASI
ncbi:IS1 family transposase, partial [Piscirickettsia salmonis]